MVQGAEKCELNQDGVGKNVLTKELLPSSLGELILIRNTNTIQF